jgi:hypothetical protein
MAIRHAPYEDGRAFEVGLILIEEDAWLEGGEADPAARKDALFTAAPDKVWGELDGSRPGQAEAAGLVARALAGQGAAAALEASLPPLLAAARMVPDDLVLMEKRDAHWRVAAISLCAGTFFTADQALSRSLDELHAPAAPGFTSALGDRTRRIFDHVPEGKVVQRRNWTVVSDPALGIADPTAMRSAIAAIAPADAAEHLFVRVERQTLRRLPQTGGVLFTIRVWVHPLAALRQDPARLAAFARAWRTADADFRAYKKLFLYDPLVEAFLGQP